MKPSAQGRPCNTPELKSGPTDQSVSQPLQPFTQDDIDLSLGGLYKKGSPGAILTLATCVK